KHAASAGLGALADHDLDRVGAAQVVGVHAVAAWQVLVDELLGMPALLLGHAAVAGGGRGTRNRRATPQRLRGGAATRSEAQPGEGDRSIEVDGLLGMAGAEPDVRRAFLAVAFQRIAAD